MTRQKGQTSWFMVTLGWIVVADGIFGTVASVMWIAESIPSSWRGWITLPLCLLAIFSGLTVVSMGRTWKDPR